MKLKKVSRTFNTYVVQKLKKLKIKGLKDKMPSEKMYGGKDTKLQTVLSNSPTTEINSTTPPPTLDVTTTTKLSNNMRTTEHYSSSPTRQKSTVPTRRTANDFRFGKAIGEGSFSTVYLTKDIHTNKEYAIKVCEKSHIIREKKQEYIKREREVMHRLINCPGFVNLSCTFQDTKSLYFVMTYAKNGDLLPYINRVGSFDMDCTRYYAAELVLALEQMHKRGIIHRDLKPENILLDEKMHTLIADFGSAKLLTQVEMSAQSLAKEDDDCGGERKRSFVGTAQYVSPEILKGTPTSRSTDLWALGCIIYQMISGLPPFRAATEYLIFQKVLKLDYKFPDGFDKTAKDLVEKLLQLDPEARLGYTDDIAEGIYTSIQTHPFFKGIDFANLRQQRPPQIHPFLPATSATAADLHSQYCVPDHLEPGLGDRQLNRLMGLELGTAFESTDRPDRFSTTGEVDLASKNFLTKPASEIQRLLDLQKHDKWHQFVDGELILKKGLVNKRKGLFARKRMLLLTTGPRLIYVDPVNMVKKGEIPWTSDLKVEPKNFKIFFVHTPNRTYYLEDPEGFALNWCKAIDDVRKCTNKYISTEILCFSSFETNVPQVREILENKCNKHIFIS